MPENQDEMKRLMAEIDTGHDPEDVADIEVIEYDHRD